MLRRLKPGFARAANLPLVKFDEQTWTKTTWRSGRPLWAKSFRELWTWGSDVRLEVVLPWILQRFAGAVQTAFKERAQLLEKKS